MVTDTNQKKKLAVAQRSMERSMLNITWRDKMRNEEIRSRTKVQDVLSNAETSKAQWRTSRPNEQQQVGQEKD